MVLYVGVLWHVGFCFGQQFIPKWGSTQWPSFLSSEVVAEVDFCQLAHWQGGRSNAHSKAQGSPVSLDYSLACSCVLLITYWRWVCSFSTVLRLQDADTRLVVGRTRRKTADGLAAAQHQPLPSAYWSTLKGKKHDYKKFGSHLGSRSLSGDFPSERSRCSVCGKTFAHHHSMLRHKWKCEGTRLIVCSICGHKAHRSDHYWLHMRIHGVRRTKQ